MTNIDAVSRAGGELCSLCRVSVISPDRQLCHALRPVVLTNKTGYLSSVVSADTGCGTGDSPWLVTLLPGQRINISLYDFTTRPDTAHALSANSTSAGSDVMGSESQSRLCRVYATVRETNGARAVTICGGPLRQRPAYVTVGHVAEIRLSTATTSIGDVTVTSHVTFLLKYEGSLLQVALYDFCRATLCIARPMPSCGVHLPLFLSVRLSVTFVYQNE